MKETVNLNYSETMLYARRWEMIQNKDQGLQFVQNR